MRPQYEMKIQQENTGVKVFTHTVKVLCKSSNSKITAKKHNVQIYMA